MEGLRPDYETERNRDMNFTGKEFLVVWQGGNGSLGLMPWLVSSWDLSPFDADVLRNCLEQNMGFSASFSLERQGFLMVSSNTLAHLDDLNPSGLLPTNTTPTHLRAPVYLSGTPFILEEA